VDTVGARIRHERVRAGLSQSQLAGPGLSASYVSLIETGARQPSAAVVDQIAAKLGVSAQYLLEGHTSSDAEQVAMELAFAKVAMANGHAEEAVKRLWALDTSGAGPQVAEDATATLARAMEMTGERSQAVALVEPLLAQAREQRRWVDAADHAMFLVSVYCELGDFARSVEIGEQVVAELEDAGLAGTDEHVRLAATLVWTYKERGDLIYATHKASQVIDVAERVGSALARGSIYWNAAVFAQESGDHAHARVLAERALANLTQGDASRDLSRLRFNYGWLLLRAQPPECEEAIRHLTAARSQLALIGSLSDVVHCDVELALAHLFAGRVDEAVELSRSALDRVLAAVNPAELVTEECHARIVLGDALVGLGDVDGGAAQYAAAADRLGMFSQAREASAVWRALADRMVRAGDFEAASRAYAAALAESGRRSNDYPMVTPGQVRTTV